MNSPTESFSEVFSSGEQERMVSRRFLVAGRLVAPRGSDLRMLPRQEGPTGRPSRRPQAEGIQARPDVLPWGETFLQSIQPGARQPTPCRWVQWGRWMFRHRQWVFSPLGAVLCVQALAHHCQYAAQPTGEFSAGFLAAFALVGLGLSIRMHVAGRARPGTSSRGVTFEAGQMVTTGMYAYVRNPLYLANLMIWAGLALLVAPAWWAGMFISLAAFFYHCIVLAEEDFLLRRFGRRYLDYCARVARWIPKLGFGRPGPGGTSNNGLSPPLTDAGVGYFSLRVSVPDAAQASSGSGAWVRCGCSDRPLRWNGTSEQNDYKFTWRRALFREADTLMLILLAGWALGSLCQGRLPWQVPPGLWGSFWPGLLAMAGIGWGWIKWLKKRSWPAGRTAGAAKAASKPAASIGSYPSIF